LIGGGFAVLLPVRLVERLLGPGRPVSGRIVQGVCRASLRLIGLPLVRRGGPAPGVAAEVANHASWLDIFVLGAASRLVFVAKSEVAGWPGIGWLARGAGTLFIRRDRREASAQAGLIAARVAAGQRLCFFPE